MNEVARVEHNQLRREGQCGSEGNDAAEMMLREAAEYNASKGVAMHYAIALEGDAASEEKLAAMQCNASSIMRVARQSAYSTIAP